MTLHLNIRRDTGGFTLTEMLVTILIMVLASTLLATGVPVAIDTYQKTVNSANAQVALSTTLTVLRSEFGTSTQIMTIDGKVYYRTEEGIWATIRNPKDENEARGLVKEYVDSTEHDEPDTAKSLGAYPLMPDATLMGARVPLYLSCKPIVAAGGVISVEDVAVSDKPDPSAADAHTLAGVGDYKIATRFAD